ncbi:hypothetical protein [Kribbella sp.]|uniref:hypothetical protein n=1 Tax=Kribbella sp. TaxID=1871183 RepID=UPI002D28CC31|nr:hypothetical protein [Kribbella sp.]HZX05674.1 hypothetical protein [Kribbella sp.]
MSRNECRCRVPLEDLGMERMSQSEIEAWSGLTGIEVSLDYQDRPSVSVDAAYELAAYRRRTEAEQRAAESRRRTEHAEAVEDLQARCNSAFLQARTAELAANFGRFGSPVAMDGAATNAGLQAAREIHAAAPPAIQAEVTSVQHEENDTVNVYPLGMSMPLSVISSYAHDTIRRHRY